MTCILCQKPVQTGVMGCGAIVCQACTDTKLAIDPNVPIQWKPYAFADFNDSNFRLDDQPAQ